MQRKTYLCVLHLKTALGQGKKFPDALCSNTINNWIPYLHVVLQKRDEKGVYGDRWSVCSNIFLCFR